MKKRLMLLFCMVSCILMVTGCSLVKENENFNKDSLESQTDAFIESWFSADFEGTIATYGEQLDDAIIEEYRGYAEMQKKYQGVDKKLKTELTIATDSATVSETILCTSGDKIVVSLSFDEDGNIQTDENGSYVFKFDEYKTTGQKMSRAGLNTVMCMAIVFAVLIFISLLISCFSLIGKIQNRQQESSVTVKTEVAAPVQTASEEDLTDDLELVAVITAAIAAASEAESTDGLVIRSIIRR